MLTLEKNNIPLNTTSDFSVQIEDQSPFTMFDAIQGAKAIGITLPANDHNRQQLRNPERFEKLGEKNDRKFEGYSARHNGQVLMDGTLIIDDTSSGYSGWLRDLVGNLAERVKGKYINQTALGGEKTFENKADYSPATDDYCCPKLFNRHFWRDRGKLTPNTIAVSDMEGNPYNTVEDIGNLTLQYFEHQAFFVNYPGETGVVSGGVDNAPVVSPFLFLWKAIEMILKDNKIFVTKNFLKDDANLIKLCLYHTWNISKQAFTTTEEIIYPLDYWGDPSGEVTNYTQIIQTITWATDNFWYKNLLPKMPIGEFILGLQNKLNILFDFNGIDEVRIIDREAVLISEAYDLDKYAVGIWKLGERKDVAIKLTSDQDNNDAAFADNWKDLSDMREYIEAAVIQRTDLSALTPELDEIRLVIGENRYYQYHWFTPEAIGDDSTAQQEDVLDWEPITLRFQPFFYNDGDRDQEEIASKFGTLRQSLNGYPIVQQQGNSAAFKTQFTNFSPRLFFYLGGDAASHQTAALSLDYDGDIGLAAKRFKYTLPFLANALPATRTFKMPASIYHYVRSQKAAMAFRTREGSFIIDKMTATASRAEMIEVEIEAFKREDNFWEYTTGSTPGSGGVNPPAFVPTYVGISSTGKPFLIDDLGAVKSPPAWGPLSSAEYAGQRCVDYVAADKLLLVGGYDGMLDIYDLSDVNSLQKKSVRILTGQISCLRVLNGHIFIASSTGNKYVYIQPYFSTLAGYAAGQTTNNAGHQPCSGVVSDFTFADNIYFGCTLNGEVFRGTDLVNWTEDIDLQTVFTRMIVTQNRLWVFGNNDRNCYQERGGPNWWHEFDLTAASGPHVIDAVSVDANKAICIAIQFGVKIALQMNDPAQHAAYITPSMAANCGGVAIVNSSIVIAIQESTGATKLATFRDLQQTWGYIPVPEFFQKLFAY